MLTPQTGEKPGPGRGLLIFKAGEMEPIFSRFWNKKCHASACLKWEVDLSLAKSDSWKYYYKSSESFMEKYILTEKVQMKFKIFIWEWRYFNSSFHKFFEACFYVLIILFSIFMNILKVGKYFSKSMIFCNNSEISDTFQLNCLNKNA